MLRGTAPVEFQRMQVHTECTFITHAAVSRCMRRVVIGVSVSVCPRYTRKQLELSTPNSVDV